VIRCVLLRIREAVEGGLCLLEVPELTRCTLLCMLEAVEGGLYLFEVLEMPEVILLEAVERGSVCWRRCAVCRSVC